MDSNDKTGITRRGFVKTTGVALAGSMVVSPAYSTVFNQLNQKRRVALVGTGSRGNSLYGKFLKEEYGDLIEFVGLCDSNKGTG